METVKKHSEEVAELNQSIDVLFSCLPQIIQVAYRVLVKG